MFVYVEFLLLICYVMKKSDIFDEKALDKTPVGL